MRAAVVLACALAAGCATPTIIGHQSARQVDVDGEKVWVARFDDGSWAATRFGLPPLIMPNPAIEAGILARAIEQASGCRIGTSSYVPQTVNMYATVKC